MATHGPRAAGSFFIGWRIVRQYFDQELLTRGGVLPAALKAYPDVTFTATPAVGR
ncbi:MAG TPA: hypothetical protein VF219_00385 [Vicinamibacterales bacterium]